MKNKKFELWIMEEGLETRFGVYDTLDIAKIEDNTLIESQELDEDQNLYSKKYRLRYS